MSLGDKSLNFDLAYVYLNDRFIPSDYEKGLSYLADGVKSNDPECLYLQARIYESGWYGVEADEKKYLHYLKKADEALDCFAICELDYVGVYWCIATIYETKKQIIKMHCSTIKWQ